MDATDSNPAFPAGTSGTQTAENGDRSRDRCASFDSSTDIDSVDLTDSLQRSAALQKKIKKARSVLYSDGKEFVTNVLTSAEAEEQRMRTRQESETYKILEYLKHEYLDSEKHFEEISSTWKECSAADVPQNLQELYLTQISDCGNLLKARDQVIAQLKEELTVKHEGLESSRNKCEEAVNEMQKRIERLINNLHQNGNNEVEQIKDSLDTIRHEFTMYCSKALQKRLEEKELRNEEYDRYDKQVWNVTEDLRLYRLVKSDKLAQERKELSAEVHNLLLKLRELESTQLLNLDKCNYGLQTLKAQIYERRMVSAEIKRSNVRLFDTLLKLRAQMRMVNAKGQQDYKRQLANYKKAYERIQASLTAARFLHRSHKKIYSDAFHQQEMEVQLLFKSVLKADCFINEMLLKQAWKLPDLSFLASKPKPEKSKEAKLLEKLKEFLRSKRKASVHDSEEADEEILQENTLKLKRPLDIEKMLQFFCDQLDFLIDKHILKLAKTVFHDTKAFIISNSVFNSMGIKTMTDLNILFAYIIHHSKSISEDEIELSPQSILMAIEDYITSQRGKVDIDDLTLDMRSDKDIIQSGFWQQYSTVITDEQELIWDEVAVALNKYMHELEKNIVLGRKKTAILQTNKELEGLLKAQLTHTETA